MELILQHITSIIINTISFFNYPGIYFLALLESTLVPIPSEIVLTFSGFLASQGKLNFWAIIIIATFGSLSGSLVAYSIGYYSEKKVIRKAIKKYGKFILLTEHEYEFALKQFRKHSIYIIFFSRMIPGLKVVISLPAGIAKVPIFKFIILTSAGSFLFSIILTFIGFKLGENWLILKPIFMKFDIIILAVTIILIGAYIYYKFRQNV